MLVLDTDHLVEYPLLSRVLCTTPERDPPEGRLMGSERFSVGIAGRTTAKLLVLVLTPFVCMLRQSYVLAI
jgi:hypothetical protein